MEKITSSTEMRTWNDHIPLQWKYTAGVAGERFLQLLKQGKFQASICKGCGKMYIPPKIFCKDCFVQLNDWKDVPEESAHLYSFTVVKGDDGEKKTLALVKFEGVEGGIIGRYKGAEPAIGMKVKTVFKPKQERIGSLSDIDHFEKREDL